MNGIGDFLSAEAGFSARVGVGIPEGIETVCLDDLIAFTRV